MNLDQSGFVQALKARHPSLKEQIVNIGGANSARFLHGGFKAGLVNLDKARTLQDAIDTDGPWAVVTAVIVPGYDSELHIALVFEGSDLLALQKRRQEMQAAGLPVNNIRFILHESGCYMTNARETPEIRPIQGSLEYGNPVPVSEILYSASSPGSALSMGEVLCVQHLKQYFPDPSVIRRLEASGSSAVPVADPASLSVDELHERISALGLLYDQDLLARFHVAMTHNPDKHFVIVQGISGTGKSSLAKAYAYAVLGLGSLSEETVRFVRVPVEPQWTDPSFLLGYEDVLSRGNYRRTEFQDALLLAWRDPTQPVFVLLDEMNRAQIEYYFSTLLSAMEIGGSITFHTAPEAVDASIPASIPWPRNVFFIGAINDDESTSPISPMVLDRANTIDLSSFDVREYCAWLAQSEPGVAVVVKDETVVGTLEKAWQILEPYGLQFGKRTVRELAMYVARSHAVAPGSAGLDDQIVQKILPKVSGTEDHYEMLVHLSRALEDFPRSHAAVLRMQDQLARTGSFKV